MSQVFSGQSMSTITLHRNFYRIFIVIVSLLAVLFLFRRGSGTGPSPNAMVQVADFYYKLLNNRKSESRKGCQFPKLDPYDPSILSYIKPPSGPLMCKRMHPDLISFEKGSLVINQSEVALNNFDNLVCRYRCITGGLGIAYFYTLPSYGSWITVSSAESAVVDCENVQVRCQTGTIIVTTVYDIMHLNVPRRLNTVPPQGANTDHPNVVLLLLDSMSRSNFLRQMPQTYAYLMNNLQAVDFRGLVKIAGKNRHAHFYYLDRMGKLQHVINLDNSYPNTIAFLSGLKPFSDESPNKMGPFDDWPLIMYNYSKKGYVTLLNEDWHWVNIFHFHMHGFTRGPPTDLYSRPFWLAMWDEKVHTQSTEDCYGNVPTHEIQWRQVLKLFREIDKRPKFAISLSGYLPHRSINRVSVADAHLVTFLKDMQPYLNNTFLFVFSDHGHRFDLIRETLVGRYEERMPFFTTVVPPWFRERYGDTLMRNMQTNSERLLSFYDFYATLLEIVQQSYAQPDETKLPSLLHGTSFFRPIPELRTCADAGIPSEYCVCQQIVSVPVNESRVQAAAIALVDHINSFYLHHASDICARLSLDTLKNAQVILPEKGVVDEGAAEAGDEGRHAIAVYTLEFMITVLTRPSAAVFEAKVDYHAQNNSFSITSDVNRINSYGNQSYCVNDTITIKYCYCVEFLRL